VGILLLLSGDLCMQICLDLGSPVAVDDIAADIIGKPSVQLLLSVCDELREHAGCQLRDSSLEVLNSGVDGTRGFGGPRSVRSRAALR